MNYLLLFCAMAGTAVCLEPANTRAAAIKDATASERFGSLRAPEAPSYRRHVIPLLSRLGCNGRECHGAFSGQGGFQLSLFGYDFEKDHNEITRDSDGGEAEVRVNTKQPLESLILTKGAALTKHKGKERFKQDSWEYNLLLKWITGGARTDVEQTGEFDRLEVVPSEVVFQKPGETVQLEVFAHWKDGTVENVTQLTRFRANDDSVCAVSDTGRIESLGPGDTHVVAFYDNGVQPVPVMRPVSQFTGNKYPNTPARTKVDELVVAKLRKLGIVPSETCTDAEFLRRVSLDLTATPPSPDEIRKFLADPSPDKRARKIEELFQTPGYAAWWATLLCDFGGNDPRRLSAPTGDENFFSSILSRQWFDWVHRRIERNEPYDKIVAGIILASGRTSPDQTYEEFAREMSSYFRSTNPADFTARADMPYFWQRNNIRKPEEKALAFAHTFLGVRIECAQCHKHPFDQWTKMDFEKFQAFFEPLRYEGRPSPGERIDFQSAQDTFKASLDPEKRGGQVYRATEFKKQIDQETILPWPEVFAVTKPLTPKEIAKRKKQNPDYSGRVLTPKILGGEEVLANQYADPREPLMAWLRSRNNPYFAPALVNRVWAVYFGRGIVDPPDDMNLANPPSNKELLDHLARGFVASGYDLKWLHRTIANSDTYQRSWQPTPSNKNDERNFSRALIRRLPAEVVFDSIALATSSATGQQSFRGDLENRAIGPNATISGKIRGGDRYALSTFGKPARNMNCDCERTSDPTLLQTLYIRNDPGFLQLLDSAKREGWMDELRGIEKQGGLSLDRTIEEVFLRSVARLPSQAELEKARGDVAGARTRLEGVRDLLWAMLNTREFMVNH
jgi:Protein of unknown function (DUF1553)/Protein of unknown function (DUF1549)